MRIKKLWPSILLILLAGCFGCDPYDSYDWDAPVEIPEHPAFIANGGPESNTITILDLDKEEIVGRRRVLPKRTDADDFAVFGNNELFFCIDWYKFDVELGDEIVIIDPSLQNMKIGSIETHPSPVRIYPISGNKAFVEHHFRSFEDSFWTTSLIDIKAKKVLKEFHIDNTLDNVIAFADGRVYIFHRGWGASRDIFMRRFFLENDSLGEPQKMVSLRFAVTYPIIVLGDSLIAGRGSSGSSKSSIELMKLPSSEWIASIPLTEEFAYKMILVNGKLYVCHNNGGTMEHGNVNKVSIVDIDSRSVTKVLEVCNAPCDIAYSEATNKIVVVSHVGTVITIIDPDTDEVIKTLVSDEVGDVDDEWGYDRLRIPE